MNLGSYQVNINISYDSDMKSDFSDLRFTYFNATLGKEVEIPLWVENYTASSSAIVWIKVPFIPASSITTIYMYYGNTEATCKSNYYNTFQEDDQNLVGLWRMKEGMGSNVEDTRFLVVD